MVNTPVRERIIEAVLAMIGSDGIAAVTNRRIAAEAHVSLGSVTYHFASQAEMLRAALVEFVAAETARLSAIAEDYRSLDLDLDQAATLVEQVAAQVAFTSEQIAAFELYIQAGRDAQLQEAAADCFAAYDRLALTILEALGVPDPEPLAQSLVALVAGMQLRRLATGVAGQQVAAALISLVRGAGEAGPNGAR
ncbi:TetR family transcriptional regulator [Rhodococcus sp. D2-41]|uniref:TetR family transcriptional regulator n=1 Tax=Speluncibacter jeojiensis TaxID=2710754 RepID=A0A9X4LVW9_9ACTN|nr:TetR/AcrR family transcriptional regulator [Rhodococcus sp. D2-41]MDG3011851.1 TetR family transcriptional regulator [Rhodococcus sp. D2-41]MDG3013303.1 TetR family transcriptional regulator [Corynebacteriales bacterium D3-21]